MEIKIGSKSVEVPDTLELGHAQPDAVSNEPEFKAWRARTAFMTLFPEAKSPEQELPVPGHQVFVLDTDNSKPVHLGEYDLESKCFCSDTGWFERNEVALWAYVPNIKNEMARAKKEKK